MPIDRDRRNFFPAMTCNPVPRGAALLPARDHHALRAATIPGCWRWWGADGFHPRRDDIVVGGRTRARRYGHPHRRVCGNGLLVRADVAKRHLPMRQRHRKQQAVVVPSKSYPRRVPGTYCARDCRCGASFVVLSFLFVFLGWMPPPDNLLMVLAGWFMLAWLGASLALLVGAGTAFSPLVHRPLAPGGLSIVPHVRRRLHGGLAPPPGFRTLCCFCRWFTAWNCCATDISGVSLPDPLRYRVHGGVLPRHDAVRPIRRA